jgi:hypothetical protein
LNFDEYFWFENMSIHNETGCAGNAADLENTSSQVDAYNKNLRHKPVAPQALSDVRLRFLAGRLHELGPKPLYYFLREIERGAELRPHLERYAALPAEFIAACGGDRFEPTASLVRGDGQ